MNATRTFAVSLTIPDNEAFTAYETLCRLGVPVARVAGEQRRVAIRRRRAREGRALAADALLGRQSR